MYLNYRRILILEYVPYNELYFSYIFLIDYVMIIIMFAQAFLKCYDMQFPSISRAIMHRMICNELKIFIKRIINSIHNLGKSNECHI